MTNRELIDQLSKLPKNMPVRFAHCGLPSSYKDIYNEIHEIHSIAPIELGEDSEDSYIQLNDAI